MLKSDKYIIISHEDLKNYAGPEWQESIGQLVVAIAAARREAKKPTDIPAFVLAMSDPYALPAVEAYRAALQRDMDTNPVIATSTQFKQLLARIDQLKYAATMVVTSKSPD